MDEIEKPIGETFKYDNENYNVVKNDNNNCKDCDLFNECKKNNIEFYIKVGNCMARWRTDGNDVIYKKARSI
jgi:hypothetical protein